MRNLSFEAVPTFRLERGVALPGIEALLGDLLQRAAPVVRYVESTGPVAQNGSCISQSILLHIPIFVRRRVAENGDGKTLRSVGG